MHLNRPGRLLATRWRPTASLTESAMLDDVGYIDPVATTDSSTAQAASCDADSAYRDWLTLVQPVLQTACDLGRKLVLALNRSKPIASPEGLFETATTLARTKDQLVAVLMSVPVNDCAFQGRTTDGRLALLTRSAQRAGQWQVTRFDADGVPWGDSQYSRRIDAIADFLREVSLRTLGDHRGPFMGIDPRTLSAAFSRWFGLSKVVDDRGRPLVVYHGTTSDFEAFSSDHLGRTTASSDAREGYFFSGHPDSADQFTWRAGEKCGHIMPVFLRLERPAFSDVVLTGGTGRVVAAQIRSAKASGHDGVIFRDSDMLGRRGPVFVVFSPVQIKSAIGNSGLFDPANPSIIS